MNVLEITSPLDDRQMEETQLLIFVYSFVTQLDR